MSNLWNWAAKDVFGLGKGRAHPGSKPRTDMYYGNMGNPDAKPAAPKTVLGARSSSPSTTGKLLGGG